MWPKAIELRVILLINSFTIDLHVPLQAVFRIAIATFNWGLRTFNVAEILLVFSVHTVRSCKGEWNYPFSSGLSDKLTNFHQPCEKQFSRESNRVLEAMLWLSLIILTLLFDKNLIQKSQLIKDTIKGYIIRDGKATWCWAGRLTFFSYTIERFSIECRKTKTKTNYLPIRLLSSSQTVVKLKPK